MFTVPISTSDTTEEENEDEDDELVENKIRSFFLCLQSFALAPMTLKALLNLESDESLQRNKLLSRALSRCLASLFLSDTCMFLFLLL